MKLWEMWEIVQEGQGPRQERKENPDITGDINITVVKAAPVIMYVCMQ